MIRNGRLCHNSVNKGNSEAEEVYLDGEDAGAPADSGVVAVSRGREDGGALADSGVMALSRGGEETMGASEISKDKGDNVSGDEDLKSLDRFGLGNGDESRAALTNQKHAAQDWWRDSTDKIPSWSHFASDIS